jgi:hypothetical protein
VVSDVAWRPVSKDTYQQSHQYTTSGVRASTDHINALGGLRMQDIDALDGPKIGKYGGLDGSLGAFRAWTQTQTRTIGMDEARVQNTPRRLQLLLPPCE